jgi:hypothetical protein
MLGHASIVLTGQVGPPHCCGGPPSGPCRRVPTHTAQASHEDGSRHRLLQHGARLGPGRCARSGAGGVYQVCSSIG